MAEHLVLGRTHYAEPLELVTTVDVPGTPVLEELGIGTDWLELVAIPTAAVIWVLRDGEPAGDWAGAST